MRAALGENHGNHLRNTLEQVRSTKKLTGLGYDNAGERQPAADVSSRDEGEQRVGMFKRS